MLSKIWYCEVCDREYCLTGKTQHLKTVKHNKKFLNRPLQLDHLEPEDESTVPWKGPDERKRGKKKKEKERGRKKKREPLEE